MLVKVMSNGDMLKCMEDLLKEEKMDQEVYRRLVLSAMMEMIGKQDKTLDRVGSLEVQSKTFAPIAHKHDDLYAMDHHTHPVQLVTASVVAVVSAVTAILHK